MRTLTLVSISIHNVDQEDDKAESIVLSVQEGCKTVLNFPTLIIPFTTVTSKGVIA